MKGPDPGPDPGADGKGGELKPLDRSGTCQAPLVDHHVHGMGHGEAGHQPEELAPFFSRAAGAGVAWIGLAEHDWFLDDLVPERTRILGADAGIHVLVGVEVDYAPGREREIARRLAGYDLDFTIGSVHTIGSWMFDHPAHIAGYGDWDPDRLWAEYFRRVACAAESGLFNIIGHLDLPKIFGCRPHRPVTDLAMPALERIREAGACIEINTAGLRKPVEEIYPSLDLLRQAYVMGIPATISSDAHRPPDVARDMSQATAAAVAAGYKELSVIMKGSLLKIPLLPATTGTPSA